MWLDVTCPLFRDDDPQWRHVQILLGASRLHVTKPNIFDGFKLKVTFTIGRLIKSSSTCQSSGGQGVTLHCEGLLTIGTTTVRPIHSLMVYHHVGRLSIILNIYNNSWKLQILPSTNFKWNNLYYKLRYIHIKMNDSASQGIITRIYYGNMNKIPWNIIM